MWLLWFPTFALNLQAVYLQKFLRKPTWNEKHWVDSTESIAKISTCNTGDAYSKMTCSCDKWTFQGYFRHESCRMTNTVWVMTHTEWVIRSDRDEIIPAQDGLFYKPADIL